MIKINLNKRGASGQPNSKLKLDSKLLNSLNLPQITLDASFLILMVVALSLAVIPHLLFVKYREQTEENHKKNIEALGAEDSKVKAETEDYKTLQAEMRSVEEQESRLNSRLAVVKTLQASRRGPVNILDAVGQLLPQRVWLTNLELNFEPSYQIQLTGKGYSSEDVAEYVEKLNSSVYFEKVILDNVSTQKEGEQQGSTKAFFIYVVPKAAEGVNRVLTGEKPPN